MGSDAVGSSNAAALMADTGGWPDAGCKMPDAAELSSPAELSNLSKVSGS